MNKTAKFAAAVMVQILIILAIIVVKMSVLATGTDVLLSIRPIDPRDMLRGDYVSFNYDISNYNAYGESGIFYNGDTVYVSLVPEGKYWRISHISRVKPRDNTVFIKGRITSGGMTKNTNYQYIGNSSYGITYGIEQYFIPENAGRNLRLGNNAAVLVSVDDSGNAVVKKLYIDGRPWP